MSILSSRRKWTEFTLLKCTRGGKCYYGGLNNHPLLVESLPCTMSCYGESSGYVIAASLCTFFVKHLWCSACLVCASPLSAVIHFPPFALVWLYICCTQRYTLYSNIYIIFQHLTVTWAWGDEGGLRFIEVCSTYLLRTWQNSLVKGVFVAPEAEERWHKTLSKTEC